MHAGFYKNNPFRRPQWRSERVMQMVERRPTVGRPRDYDDHYVRAYRRFLLAYQAAGNNEDARYAVFLNQPHIYTAHLFHYHPDKEWRDILQARILTRESYEDIGARLATDGKTIEYFEKLFFNVLDRIDHHDWITKVVSGSPEERARNKYDTMTENQRAFLYRLFGYYGGALVLDAVISGLTIRALPLKTDELSGWFDHVLMQLVNIRATMAARIFEVNRYNVMHLIETSIIAQNAAKAAAASAGSQPTDLSHMAGKICDRITMGLVERHLPQVDEKVRPYFESATEPRAGEQILMAGGEPVPLQLVTDSERVEKARKEAAAKELATEAP